MKLIFSPSELSCYELAIRANRIYTHKPASVGTGLIVGPEPEIWFPNDLIAQICNTSAPTATILTWHTATKEEGG